MSKSKSAESNSAEDILAHLIDELQDVDAESSNPHINLDDETEVVNFKEINTEDLGIDLDPTLLKEIGAVEGSDDLISEATRLFNSDNVDLEGTLIQSDQSIELDSKELAEVESENASIDQTNDKLDLDFENLKVPVLEPFETVEEVIEENTIELDLSEQFNPDFLKDSENKSSDQIFDKILNEDSSIFETEHSQGNELRKQEDVNLTHEMSIDDENHFDPNQPLMTTEVVNTEAQSEIEPSGEVFQNDLSEKTVPLFQVKKNEAEQLSENTIAVTGFSNRKKDDDREKIKISVGQSRSTSYQSNSNSQNFYSQSNSWGSADSQLLHAENLRVAQEKILDLEKQNEKLRLQNEELIAASEIVRERADLLKQQINEYKNDKEALSQSFKDELQILKSQSARKDAELYKAQVKVDELESRMKYDLKKIRVRERELENRLELIRAEKFTLMKSKDEQILDLKRRNDQMQLEIESYRQKCVEFNKLIENNQESFKRTTRALRLAMANLEIQEESKPALKKVD